MCVDYCSVCVLLIREKDFKWMMPDDHCHPYNDTYVVSTNLLYSNDAELDVHM